MRCLSNLWIVKCVASFMQLVQKLSSGNRKSTELCSECTNQKSQCDVLLPDFSIAFINVARTVATCSFQKLPHYGIHDMLLL